CSNVSVQAHQEIGYDSKKIQVIPNGFDLQNFSFEASAAKKVRDELGLPFKTPLVGVIGRYHIHKNHLGFLEAASLVHKKIPDVHFLLIGQDVDASNAELVQAIKRHGLEKVVHLLGYREDTSYLLSALDVFALPSLAEAFPNVLGEAMACGLPSVVTNSGDSAAILGEAGHVAGPTDMKEFANGLLKILHLSKQDRKSLGSLARCRVEDHYNIKDVIRRYEDFYESLMLS
ncbi:MAG: glycosyltransferase, partial [bacterium]|nr:glycosyltransferase [bacterium]